ncbi:hypothetical protein D046_2906B, partial [Vibrio parahaemolyticus V-223/04]
QTSLVLLRHC